MKKRILILRNPSSTDDNTPGTIWLSGMIERNDIRRSKLYIVPNKRVDTLTAVLRENILPGSIIATDGYSFYPQAVENIGCSHIVVNHSEGFTNEEGESTNKIENLWFHSKGDIWKEYGVQFSNIEKFIIAFTFREKYIVGKKTEELHEIFIRILKYIFVFQ